MMLVRIFIGLALILSLGCATQPPARTVRITVEWIRSTLAHDNLGYRHAERTAPLLDGGVVYQGNGLDGVVAMDRNTGHQIWRLGILNGVESGFATADGFLYFGASDGQFYCVSKSAGKIIWTFPTRVENLSQPITENGVVYFLAGNNVFYALDGKTGKQLWLYNRGENSSLSIRGGTKPALYKGTLYVGFSDGFLVALNSHDGGLIWERKLATNLKFIDVDASPIVDETNIWVASYDGALFNLSRGDGQILWRLEEGGSTAVAIEGDVLYYASLNQNIFAINKHTGAQIWKYSYEEKRGVPTQPILYKGMVLVGSSAGNLMAISQTSGKLLAHYQPGMGIFATPAIDENGNIFIFSNEANLHVLKIAWHRPQDGYEWME